MNIEDDEGLTPLHYACRINRKKKKRKKSRVDLFDGTASSPDVVSTIYICLMLAFGE